MQQTKLIMGMPITVEIRDAQVRSQDFRDVFQYFRSVDNRFSPYKKTSEVSFLNRHEISFSEISPEMQEVIHLADKTTSDTHGYFDIYSQGYFDPSGIVKGWAIQKAAELLHKKNLKHFALNVGGDIQVSGQTNKGEKWRVGIKNPFDVSQIVKVVAIEDQGIATSGTYIRGDHIHTPEHLREHGKKIVSLSVIGPTVFDADRFATAAFAMGHKGISFIESLQGYEGYMIDDQGIATMTSGFSQYTC